MNKKTKEQENTDFYNFCKLWVKANEAYKSCFRNNHLQFPEPALKKLIGEHFKLKKKKSGSSYDFDDDIELKSVTIKNGNIPFQFSENNCKKIYYCEILGSTINVYHLGEDEVKQVNKEVSQKKTENKENKSSLNISLKKYKSEIIDKYDLNEGVWESKKTK